MSGPFVATNSDNDLRIGATSDPKAMGSVLARAICSGHLLTMRAIGAGAVNQMVKAAAISRGYAAPQGIDVAFVPGFEDGIGDNGESVSLLTFRPVLLR